jgi:glycosyltransferase involved in cell wall biosynthesis
MRFGYLGRISPEKGVEVLLEAASKLPLVPPWTLELGGRGSAKYIRFLRSKYRVPATTFLGQVKTASFFSRIDVLVAPSVWYEPFGRTVIEAYAHGSSVIGSDRGGIAELIEDGHTGHLFDPTDPDNLTAKMQHCIDKPNFVVDMQQRVLEKSRSFLPEDIAHQYLEVYADVVR